MSCLFVCLFVCFNRNVFLWDTLLPTKTSIVKGMLVSSSPFTYTHAHTHTHTHTYNTEFVCHEAGVVSLGYSRSKQHLFCGDRRGEVLIFDLKQMNLLQSLTVHGSAVNRIAVDDIDGFFVTGSSDGDIKVCLYNNIYRSRCSLYFLFV